MTADSTRPVSTSNRKSVAASDEDYKIPSFVWVYLADSEVVRSHCLDKVNSKVVGLACLCVQLVQRHVIIFTAAVGGCTEVVLTGVNRCGEVASTPQGTKPLPVSADPCATGSFLHHHVDQRFAVLTVNNSQNAAWDSNKSSADFFEMRRFEFSGGPNQARKLLRCWHYESIVAYRLERDRSILRIPPSICAAFSGRRFPPTDDLKFEPGKSQGRE